MFVFLNCFGGGEKRTIVLILVQPSSWSLMLFAEIEDLSSEDEEMLKDL